jgi:hypothetical protein
MGVPIGPLCAMYVDTAFDFDSPTFVEATGVNEFSVDRKWTQGDVKTRRTRIDETKKTRMAITATGTYLVDPDDPIYALLVAAADGDYPVHILILNGKDDEVGARGLKAWFEVNGGAESQGPEDIVYMPFELKPAADRPLADNPQRAVVEAGPTLTYSDFGAAAP